MCRFLSLCVETAAPGKREGRCLPGTAPANRRRRRYWLLSPELVAIPVTASNSSGRRKWPPSSDTRTFAKWSITSPWDPSAGGLPISTQFLCLELMAGGTLADGLYLNTAFRRNVARWIDVLADALQVPAHHDVIHGNLKPTSVVFDTEENVYLTDFAVAQRVLGGEGESVMGMLPIWLRSCGTQGA